MKKCFYDTCSLLLLQEKAFENPFIISSKTLEEIEHIKVSNNRTEDIKYKARNIARLLDKNADKYEVSILYQHNYDTLEKEFGLPSSNDNLILVSAFLWNKEIEPITFVSNDINCKVIGRDTFSLEVDSVEEEITDEYLGYKEVVLDDESMAYFYEHLNENQFGCLTNEYVVVKNINNEVIDKQKWNGSEFVPISYKLINNDFIGKIKPRNLQQELSFDMLQDKNTTIKILTGGYGTGKDYLMISTALDLIKTRKYEKIMWVRNNIEVKNSKPIGFLPNGMKDKLLPFAMIMADHLGGIEGLELFLSQGKIEIAHLGFMRGRDIKNTIIMCSEAENMTKEHIQLLIGRVGEGSALWLNGDYRQVDNEVFERNNGLIKSITKLKGNPMFGFVKLQTTERSQTAQLADLLD